MAILVPFAFKPFPPVLEFVIKYSLFVVNVDDSFLRSMIAGPVVPEGEPIIP